MEYGEYLEKNKNKGDRIHTEEQALKYLAGKVSDDAQGRFAIQRLSKTFNKLNDEDRAGGFLFGKLWLAIYQTRLIEYGSHYAAMADIQDMLKKPMDHHFKEVDDVLHFMEDTTKLMGHNDREDPGRLKAIQSFLADSRKKLTRSISMMWMDDNNMQ